MQNVTLFSKYIDDAFHKKDDFSVQILDNPPLLYQLLTFIGSKDQNIMKQVDRFFKYNSNKSGPPIRRQIYEILQLDYERLYREAKSAAPVGGGFSLIDIILNFLHIFSKSMGKAIESQLNERKNMTKISEQIRQNQELKKAEKKNPVKKETKAIDKKIEKKREVIKAQFHAFKKELVQNKSTGEMLSFYESKWNRKLSKDAKEDNLRIVKEKIHHRLKFMINPSPAIILKEADDMMKTETIFESLSDTEALKNYIILYMTEYMSQKFNKEPK